MAAGLGLLSLLRTRFHAQLMRSFASNAFITGSVRMRVKRRIALGGDRPDTMCPHDLLQPRQRALNILPVDVGEQRHVFGLPSGEGIGFEPGQGYAGGLRDCGVAARRSR